MQITKEQSKVDDKGYLLTFNVINNEYDYTLETWEKEVEDFESGKSDNSWTTGKSKNIPKGSRIFILRQGASQGIVGFGHTQSSVFVDGKENNRVDINLKWATKEPPDSFAVTKLQETHPISTKWSPQSSGTSISKEIADFLENEIRKLSKTPSVKKDSPVKKSLNQILYGPPGTGKTYKCKKLAIEVIDEKHD